jgi:hypothetical protein
MPVWSLALIGNASGRTFECRDKSALHRYCIRGCFSPLLIRLDCHFASIGVIVATASLKDSRLKCPYRAAIRTIVAGAQPTIFATLGSGTPASIMREMAVCRRS